MDPLEKPICDFEEDSIKRVKSELEKDPLACEVYDTYIDHHFIRFFHRDGSIVETKRIREIYGIVEMFYYFSGGFGRKPNIYGKYFPMSQSLTTAMYVNINEVVDMWYTVEKIPVKKINPLFPEHTHYDVLYSYIELKDGTILGHRIMDVNTDESRDHKINRLNVSIYEYMIDRIRNKFVSKDHPLFQKLFNSLVI